MTTRPDHWRNLLAVLLALAMLSLRLGGDAHLHLCLDGAGEPSSVHILDSGIEDEQGAEVGLPHHDLTISLAARALSKSGRLGVDPLVLLSAVVALFALFVVARLPVPLFAIGARPPSPPHLRPLLRGPPL